MTDIATATAHRDAWLAANLALTRNAEYTMPDGRTLKRTVDIAEIRGEINYWQRVINELTAAAAGDPNPGIKVATWPTRR